MPTPSATPVAEAVKPIAIQYIAADGETVDVRCFNESHAMRLEEILDAEGLPHARAGDVS